MLRKKAAILIALGVFLGATPVFAQIELPGDGGIIIPGDGICPPNCDIPLDPPDEFKIWNIQFEKPSPAGYEPREQIKISFNYEAMDTVRFFLRPFASLGSCESVSVQALNAPDDNNFPPSLGAKAEMGVSCDGRIRSDSIEIRMVSDDGLQFRTFAYHQSYFQVDSVYDTFVSPVESDLNTWIQDP